MEFVTRLVIAWVSHRGNRWALITFASDTKLEHSLTNTIKPDKIREVIEQTVYTTGGTASSLGLRMAAEEFVNNSRQVPQNLVFLTDGMSQDENETIKAAKEVNGAGYKTVSVGIGPALRQSELLEIAGNNLDHVFNTDGFDDLLLLLHPVSTTVCKNSKQSEIR